MQDDQTKKSLDDALAIMRDLRVRDAWDKAQTHESLRPYLNEEAHELDDALRDRDARRDDDRALPPREGERPAERDGQ